MAKAHFGSDNTGGVAPEIMAAIAAANRGGFDAYGGDPATQALDRRFGELFETEVRVLPVGTGSIANALSLALLTPPWGAVFCADKAHIANDEANAPEFFTGGAKLVTVATTDGRLAVEDVRRAASAFPRDDVHNTAAAALSVTQATEMGTLYRPEALRELGALGREVGLGFHMDGARFANAVAALGCRPADLTWRAGVDVLSFGGTKNGCLAVEAVIVFGALRERFPRLARLHKRAGQLFAKMRFFTAQLEAYLDGGNWLRWAGHANDCAQRLAGGLAALDAVELVHPAEANEIFLRLPVAIPDAWSAAGFGLYKPTPDHDGRGLMRLVTSFDTDPADIDRLVELASRA